MPLSFFETRHTGDLLQRINDHNRIEKFITGTALQTIFSFFSFFVFSVILFSYNQNIFWVFVASSVLYLGWISIFLRYRKEIDFQRFGTASKENSITIQLIEGINEIKLNNAEHMKRWEWERIQSSLFKLGFKSLSLSQYQQTGAFFINQGKNIIITFMVATYVLDGNLTLGAMIAIQSILGSLNSPIEQLISFIQQGQDAKISLERLNEIHQLEEEDQFGKSYSTIPENNESIFFKGLSFAYPGIGNTRVLSNLDIEFKGGEVTAIVGISGSGKSTILKLLQGIYSSYSGEIKIGNLNLRNINSSSWRSVSSSITQDGYIFNDSIASNIALGDEVPNLSQLIESCRIANILEFVESLPGGFNTKIGNEGFGISSGQRQRILIARAVYKNPRFFFLDEATNSLDAISEKVIMENLKEFFKGRTVIIIAHRLSTIKDADKIIMLDEGRVIEMGVHNSLIKKGEKYYHLLKNQMELQDDYGNNKK